MPPQCEPESLDCVRSRPRGIQLLKKGLRATGICLASGSMELIAEEGKVNMEKLVANMDLQHEESGFADYLALQKLRDQLITIKGYVDLLQHDLSNGDPEEVGNDLYCISNAAGRMDQLLDGLLEISHFGQLTSEPEDVHMDELACEVRAIIRGQSGNEDVQIDVSPDLPIVHGDRFRLQKLLRNAMGNSLKYMGESVLPAD